MKVINCAPPEVEVITIHLTMKEATVLRNALGWIGGSPDHSPRAVTQALYDKLMEAGVPFYAEELKVKGSIYYEDYQKEC